MKGLFPLQVKAGDERFLQLIDEKDLNEPWEGDD
jgi:hypothetical protein